MNTVENTVPVEYANPNENLKIAGFWLFLTQDMVMFACLFATYIVLHTHTAGGPTASHLYDVHGFLIETFLLLFSSFTCGLATLEMRRNNSSRLLFWLFVTIALGAGFVGMEIHEFSTYLLMGATPQRSAFLSAFFFLVGTHGLHVTIGIFWIIAVMIQVKMRGLTPATSRKIFVTGLYWHFLDIVWIFIYTVVYLSGVMK